MFLTPYENKDTVTTAILGVSINQDSDKQQEHRKVPRGLTRIKQLVNLIDNRDY